MSRISDDDILILNSEAMNVSQFYGGYLLATIDYDNTLRILTAGDEDAMGKILSYIVNYAVSVYRGNVEGKPINIALHSELWSSDSETKFV